MVSLFLFIISSDQSLSQSEFNQVYNNMLPATYQNYQIMQLRDSVDLFEELQYINISPNSQNQHQHHHQFQTNGTHQSQQNKNTNQQMILLSVENQKLKKQAQINQKSIKYMSIEAFRFTRKLISQENQIKTLQDKIKQTQANLSAQNIRYTQKILQYQNQIKMFSDKLQKTQAELIQQRQKFIMMQPNQKMQKQHKQCENQNQKQNQNQNQNKMKQKFTNSSLFRNRSALNKNEIELFEKRLSKFLINQHQNIMKIDSIKYLIQEYLIQYIVDLSCQYQRNTEIGKQQKIENVQLEQRKLMSGSQSQIEQKKLLAGLQNQKIALIQHIRNFNLQLGFSKNAYTEQKGGSWTFFGNLFKFITGK